MFFTLEYLQKKHKYYRDIITSTPDLDPLIQEALSVAVKADGEYVLGLELDLAATRRQNQLVFAVFEENAGREISRVLLSESKL